MKLTNTNSDLAGRTLSRSDKDSEALAFFEKYERPPNDLCIVLEKYKVTPMLFHLVGVALESIQNNLIEGELYTPSELVGDEHWGPGGYAWKREIELCIKHFTTYPEFGLRATGCGDFERVE